MFLVLEKKTKQTTQDPQYKIKKPTKMLLSLFPVGYCFLLTTPGHGHNPWNVADIPNETLIIHVCVYACVYPGTPGASEKELRSSGRVVSFLKP